MHIICSILQQRVPGSLGAKSYSGWIPRIFTLNTTFVIFQSSSKLAIPEKNMEIIIDWNVRYFIVRAKFLEGFHFRWLEISVGQIGEAAYISLMFNHLMWNPFSYNGHFKTENQVKKIDFWNLGLLLMDSKSV